MTSLSLAIALNALAGSPGSPADIPHEVTGIATGVRDSAATLRLRDGRTIYVDARAAKAAHQQAIFVVGQAYLVRGEYAHNGLFMASSAVRSKTSPALWVPDR